MPLPTAAAPTEVHVAHCLTDADGRTLAAHDADRPFYAASTIKLHVLLAALRAAEAGSLDLDAALPATRAFTGADGRAFTLGGDHLDPTHPADGEPIAVRDLLRRMIDRSSNEATDHVIELIGLDAVARTIADLGLRATRVERMIGDASALEAGATNETSAGDLAQTLCAVLREDVDPLAVAALRAQRIPIIAAVLREDVGWGSKSGWVDGYRHDVAFVDVPGGPGRRVLAVMTSGLAAPRADGRITGLARELLPAATV